MFIPSVVVVSNQDNDCQSKYGNLLIEIRVQWFNSNIRFEKGFDNKLLQHTVLISNTTYQRNGNHPIVKTPAPCNPQAGVKTGTGNKENQNYEQDIDDGEGPASGDWIDIIWSRPTGYDLSGGMHNCAMD